MLSGNALCVLFQSILLDRLKRILSGVVRMVKSHGQHSSKFKEKHEDNHMYVLIRDRDTLYLKFGALLSLTEGTAGQEAAFRARTLI